MLKLLDSYMKFAVLIVLAVVVTACVQAPPPSVGLKPLSADIVFGIPPLDEPVALPDATGPRGRISIAEPLRPIPPAPPETIDCDQALYNEVEKQADEATVVGQPQEGTYKWVDDGYVKAGDFGNITLAGLSERSIVDVKKAAGSPQDFTYRIEQTESLGGQGFTLDFEVIRSRPKPPPVTNQVYYETTSKNSLNGIYLTAVTTTDQNGQEQQFIMSPAVLYLPIPVPIGVTFTTTSSNPDQLVTFKHEGRVTQRPGTDSPRARFDACGELIEGWWVDGFQTFSFGGALGTTTRNYDYAIATQYGGMLIAEELVVPCDWDGGKCTNEPDLVYKSHIGQIEP